MRARPGSTHRSELALLAELGLGALTVGSMVGLTRLFEDLSFLPPVLGFAVAAHVLAATCRRRGLGLAPMLAVAAGGLALAASWVLLPESTTLGLPGPGTLAQAGRELSAAMASFRDVVAPAPVEPGFVLAGAIAAWVVAFAADSSAFRTGAALEAAVPGTTVFVFGAALGGPDQRVTSTAAFLTGLVAYWLTQRVRRQASRPTWVASDPRTGSRAQLASGAVAGGLAVVAALVLGPLLPGTEAQAVIPWRSSDRDGPGTRVTVSPLVDIRAQLVDQADVEVFSVRSDARSYWRLTSLERFDGRIWSSRGRYRPGEGTLDPGVPAESAATTAVNQEFQVGALSSIWLPAAYRPVEVEGVDARYDADSASLLTEEETASGLRYRVRSALPTLEGDELSLATDLVPTDLAATYTALPDGFSATIQEEASRVVAAAPTQYGRARQLQDYFRAGFAYDLGVSPGHAGDDLERFVFETRRGYCEQFAGAFAAMARSVGLPARVAVGFTTGELGADGLFHVRGLNAHAWPEVFLAGYGWVAFEPTPGRGIPGGEPYTGVAEQQATPAGPATATTVTPTTAPASTPTTADDADPDGTGGDGAGRDAPGESAPPEPTWGRRLAVAGAVVVGGPALWAMAVTATRRRRRARRRAAARTPGARVLVAWEEVGEALALTGTPPRSWETPSEYARRAATAPGVDAGLLGDLAAATTAADYAAGGIPKPTADQAVDAGARIEASVHGGLDRHARWRRALDPRPLWPARPSHLDIRVEELPTGAPALSRPGRR